MNKSHTTEVELSAINQRINEARNRLNELCYTYDKKDAGTILIVSKDLDKLIVKYMELRNRLK